MARWLARRHGARLEVDWGAFENGARLLRWLYMLVLQGEHVALAEVKRGAREWVRALKRADETDAAFLVRRFDALGLDPLARQLFYEDLDLPLRLRPGPGGLRARARATASRRSCCAPGRCGASAPSWRARRARPPRRCAR